MAAIAMTIGASGSANAQNTLSVCTPNVFVPDGDIGEFINFAGDSQEYFVVNEVDADFGKIRAGADLACGVFVARDDFPPFAAPNAAGPSGFRDRPGVNTGGTPVPTSFNIGRMFVSYNPQIDAYFVAFDVSAPSALDGEAGTQPRAFDIDGDGDLCTLSEINPVECAAQGTTEAPAQGDDRYRVLLDLDQNGFNDVRVQVVETTGSPPGGSVVLTSYNCGGSLPIITRYLSIEPLGVGAIDAAAFARAHLDSNGDGAADSGAVGVDADVEFMISNVSKGCDLLDDPNCANDPFLTLNADPCCVDFRSFVDTDDDNCLGGGAEDGTSLDVAFPCPDIEVTKEVKCVDDPDSAYADHIEALPGAELEFRVTIQNLGNRDLDVTIDDLFDCIDPATVTLVPGSCQPAGAFCTAFEAGFQLGTPFSVDFGTLAGPSGASDCPVVGDGETFTFVFRVRVGEDDPAFCDDLIDCTNAISVSGETTPEENPLPDGEEEDGNVDDEFTIKVCDRAPGVDTNDCDLVSGPPDDNDVEIEIECRGIDLVKEVRLLPDGTFASQVEIPSIRGGGEQLIEYRYTVSNNGEVDEDVTLTDQFLCADVAKTPGVELVPGECTLCEAAPVAQIIDTIPAGQTRMYTCQVRFTDQAALRDFMAQDDKAGHEACTSPDPQTGGEDPDCYRNCASVSATVVPDLEGICDDAGAITEDSSATICNQECVIEVTKQVRCLPDCNKALLGAEEGWVDDDDPAVLEVTPGACVQYRIIVENTGDIGVCTLNFNDEMSEKDNFASGPDNVQVTGPTTCANLPGEFNWDGSKVLCELDPPLQPGQELTVLFEGTLEASGVADPGVDPSNTITVNGASSCEGDLVFTCEETDSVAIDIQECSLEVTKEVKCVDDPDSAYAHEIEALPGTTSVFRIQVCNTGDLIIQRITITDLLSCASPGFVADSVVATIGANDVTNCICTDANNSCDQIGDLNGPTKDLTSCVPGGIPPSECLTITFEVKTDVDCTNTVTVEGFTDVCSPTPNPCGEDTDSATIDVKVPSVDCDKCVCADLDNDGTCDTACLPVLKINDDCPEEFQLQYTFTVRNNGETDLSDAEICDPNLVGDAVEAGATVGPCDLNDVCADLGDIPAGGSAVAKCTIKFPNVSAWDRFANCLNGEQQCYQNTAEASAAPDTSGSDICDDPPPPEVRSFGCSALFACGDRPCEPPPCPPVTKARFDIWNQNEARFSGTERCISSWDQTLLSQYTRGGLANHFHRSVLQTDKGKTRINGVGSIVVCGDESIDAPLVGVAAKVLHFGDGIDMAGMSLVGAGQEAGQIIYDPAGSGGEELQGDRSRTRNRTNPRTIREITQTTRGRSVPGAAAGLTAPPALQRASISNKGSFLVFPKVEIKWDRAGNLIQDTFLDIANDNIDDVDVQLYFVDGELCTWTDNVIHLTANEPAYWSALTGQPKGVSPFTVLGRGCPDDDPENPGGRRLHGYVLAWAVDTVSGEEIRWNHLKGDALIINYRHGSAWEYNTWAFQAVAGTNSGDILLAPLGQLDLDGIEYEAAPATLLLDFYAVGATVSSGPAASVGIDTDLTLWAVIKDLRKNGGD